MKKIILFALAAITLISFCSCGARYSDTEIKEVLDELLPKSFEMNEIYFGKGLPISEDKDVLDDYYSGFDRNIIYLNCRIIINFNYLCNSIFIIIYCHNISVNIIK